MLNLGKKHNLVGAMHMSKMTEKREAVVDFSVLRAESVLNYV